MKVALCDQMKNIDKQAIEKFGIPGIVLMENAALKVVEEIKREFEDYTDKKIIIFCGKGNNGGDGFAIGRHLYNSGSDVLVILMEKREKIKGDALVNLDIISKLGLNIIDISEKGSLDQIQRRIFSSDIVVDAIFGTGIKGDISGAVKDIIHLINRAGRYVVSVDIPSGINGDTGEICGICIHADKTITFALPKLGLLTYPGANHVGDLKVVDISIPNSMFQHEDININTIDREYIKNIFPMRAADSNKGDYGKLFIVAGSIGMTGAATLAGEAAMRTGSGLVTVGIPRSLNHIMEIKLTEAMTFPLEDDNTGVLSSSSADEILKRMEKSEVLLFGPGLSAKDSIHHVLERILKASNIPVVIDADGINVLSRNINVLKECKCPIVITPHPGEMSRLIGMDKEWIQGNRLEVAKGFAQEWNVSVVLKGARTIIAHPNGEEFINCTGNSGMATGGTGDVLSGIITSLIGQGLSIYNASEAGVYLHGVAGDLQANIKGEYGMIASDIIEMLPTAIQQIMDEK